MKQFVLAVLIAPFVAACGSNGSPTDPSQVVIQFSTVDLATGTGSPAASGNAVNTNYTLWLYDPNGTDRKGRQLEAGNFPLVLGRQQSIPGYEQGVIGMQVGGKRRIYVPASLGYGSRGQGEVPPNAALVFEVELLEIVQ